MPARPLPAHPGATSPSPPGSDYNHTALPDEYDADLLARAPELTREQRQAGYDTGLLSTGARQPPGPGALGRVDSDPPVSPLYGGGFSPMGAISPVSGGPGHGARASSTEKLTFQPDGRTSAAAGAYGVGHGMQDERAVYSPVDGRPYRGDQQQQHRPPPGAAAAMGMGAGAGAAVPRDAGMAEYEKTPPRRSGYDTRRPVKPWYKRPIGFVLIGLAIVVLIIVIAVPVAVTKNNSHKSSSSSGSSSSNRVSTTSPSALGEGSTPSNNGGATGAPTNTSNLAPPGGQASGSTAANDVNPNAGAGSARGGQIGDGRGGTATGAATQGGLIVRRGPAPTAPPVLWK